MVRRVLISVLLVLAVTSAAWAQSPKVEVAGLFGYTLSDGVSGDPYKAGDGNTYDRVDLKDSMNYGLAFGVFLGPNAQIGFLWRRQPTTFQVSGPSTTKDVADVNIDYVVSNAQYSNQFEFVGGITFRF